MTSIHRSRRLQTVHKKAKIESMGQIENKFGEVDEVKKLCDYGFGRHQYSLAELHELEKYFAEKVGLTFQCKDSSILVVQLECLDVSKG